MASSRGQGKYIFLVLPSPSLGSFPSSAFSFLQIKASSFLHLQPTNSLLVPSFQFWLTAHSSSVVVLTPNVTREPPCNPILIRVSPVPSILFITHHPWGQSLLFFCVQSLASPSLGISAELSALRSSCFLACDFIFPQKILSTRQRCLSTAFYP